VIRTRVGYAGGKTEQPNYRRMGDHTETVQIDYDPAVISYEQLLDAFWKSHDPTRRSFSTQYKRVVFFNNAEQQKKAEASKQALEKKLGKPVRTQIAPLKIFTLAEEYHQKYLLKHHPLKEEVLKIYPDEIDWVDSTAAARLNGYAGGHGSQEQLDKEIKSLGLSAKGEKMLSGRFEN
jgi:methionine-S-sulfoxide reductase